jgi:hypothetical protein
LLILCLLGEVEFGVEILWAFFRRVNHTYTKFHIILKKNLNMIFYDSMPPVVGENPLPPRPRFDFDTPHLHVFHTRLLHLSSDHHIAAAGVHGQQNNGGAGACQAGVPAGDHGGEKVEEGVPAAPGGAVRPGGMPRP